MLPVGGRQTAKFGSAQLPQRVEDPRLLKGFGRYTDDVTPAGALHGVVVRSQHARARLVSVSAEAAWAMPGVVAVYLAEDLERGGVGDIPCVVPLQNRDGTPLRKPPHPALARGEVRHVGDPVAFVVAETTAAARDAAEAVEVEYEALPSITDLRAATEADAPQVWAEAPGNVCFDWETGDKARVDEIFSRAAHVTRLEIKNNRIVVASMEARAALAEYDPADGRWTLHTNTQGVWFVKDLLGQVFGVEPGRFRVVTDDVGGGFGMKIFLYAEQVLACYPRANWVGRSSGRRAAARRSWPTRTGAITSRWANSPWTRRGASSRCARASSPTWGPTSATTPPTSRRWPARRCSRACTTSRRFTWAFWACSRTPFPWMPTAARGGRRATTWSSA